MSKHIPNYIKVVLFDHDDTLVKTIEPKWAEHRFIAKKYYGKDLTDEELHKHWGKPLTEMMCLLYGTDDVEQATAHNVKHHEDYPKILLTYTVPTLRQLHKDNLLTGIITATSRFSFEHDLALHKITNDLIDYTQTADDTAYHKPNPRVFEPVLAWLKKRNIKPSEVVYVGDGLQDMEAALGAGFNFIGVESGLITAEQFKQKGAKSVPHIGHLVK